MLKYVCKGSDLRSVQLVRVHQHHDETGHFRDARHLSVLEAHWRIVQFQIFDRSPAVVRLDVHLENHYTLYFRERRENQATTQSRPGTKLTKWFAENQT